MKHVTKKKKTFNKIEKNPSLLGFGCMRFPLLDEEDSTSIDEARAEAMIDFAYKRGVNYFDTAYPYHGGASEPFMGRVLKKYPRDRFYLASKMPGWEVETLDDVKRIFDEQLKRCQVDYFDYYLCHALSEKNLEVYKIPGVMAYLSALKAEGKIKYLGFSFHDTPAVLEEIIAYHDWDFVQLQINYLDWDFQDAKRQYALAKEAGLPVIVMEPVRGGTLAHLSKPAAQLLKHHHPKLSIASWAMRYVASLDQVICVLSGMSNQEQTLDNIETLTDFKPLDHKEEDTLSKALAIFLESRIIPCTKCNYCMPCPYGVDIPKVFDIYNQYKIDEKENFFNHRYEAIDAKKRADQCVSCQECLEKCPQHIDIPTLMGEIDRFYQKIKAAKT